MAEDDIHKAANELLGEEGEDWRLVTRGNYERYVVFDHMIPVRKRVDFHLLENLNDPAERIQKMIDWHPLFPRDA